MFRRLAAVAAASSSCSPCRPWPSAPDRTRLPPDRDADRREGWVCPQLGIDAGVGVDAEKSVVEIDTNDDFVDDTASRTRWPAGR